MKAQGLHSDPLIVPQQPSPAIQGPGASLPGASLISQQPAPQPPPQLWFLELGTQRWTPRPAVTRSALVCSTPGAGFAWLKDSLEM